MVPILWSDCQLGYITMHRQCPVSWIQRYDTQVVTGWQLSKGLCACCNYVQMHVQTQHPDPCDVCGDTRASCEHTQATRSAQKTRHRCARCARTFESAAALHVHERVHTGEKPEVCETCGRAFQHRSNLQKHMMKHAGRRPHICSMCPRAFYARHSLLAHMRKHTGDSPYHCEKCGKRFCTKNSLQVGLFCQLSLSPLIHS